MTNGGGTASGGTIFKVGTTGTGFSLLHSFAGGSSDGKFPSDSLILSGSTLYGMTPQGGTANSGTVFKINTDGTGFSVLHSFAGGASDGSSPFGSLILDGSTLYGMTEAGGSGNAGTVFQIGTNGTGFSLLHTFSNGATDGAAPFGSLVESGSTLYGMTSTGGTYFDGTIFKIGTNGAGFSLMYSFKADNTPTDGKAPQGSLLLSGSTLYGMTKNGYIYDDGTLFKIGTDGLGYTRLHAFTGPSTDGSHPFGSLLQSGATLYGVTEDGGANVLGTIFKIGTDGTGYGVLHSFDFSSGGGYNPYGSLVQSGSTFYGMTRGGTGAGTLFAFTFPIAGDYNLDGMVNAADYATWRKTDNTTGGYNTWRANFGHTSSSGPPLSDTLVPEPTALSLLAFGVLVQFLRARRPACS